VDGGSGSQLVKNGKLKEVCDYCETDVIATYRVWLRYQLFRGGLTLQEFHASEVALADFLNGKLEDKPHLKRVVPDFSALPIRLDSPTVAL
jgi:predicted PolB exonuclease-like 3'-5' exonuclease